MKNKYQSYPNIPRRDFGQPVKLPLSFSLGVYARQSTVNQVIHHRQSREIQTEDLVKMGIELGWQENSIILFVENIDKNGRIRGSSGKLRIDQREGLRALTEYIEKGVIKAVLVYMEDRLFRDETMIQANTFIDICKRNDTIVITPHKIYDFHNRFDVKQFRWRCEEAADYLRDYTWRLSEALRRVSERGMYDGRPVPPGFILDWRELIIVDDQPVPNPGYRKYQVYEPHARIVRQIFDLAIQLDCQVRAIYKELMKQPVLFPSFPSTMAAKVIGNRSGMTAVPGGFHIASENGVRAFLTQIAFLGHWLYRGHVYEFNHPAIVDPDKFWFVFRRLSPYLPNGEENDERPVKVRFYKKHSPQALLKHCIETSHENRNVYVSNKFGAGWYYEIVFVRSHQDYGRIVTIQVEHLDDIFVNKLMEHLRESTCYEHYRCWLSEREEQVRGEIRSIEVQLRTIEGECSGIQQSLRNPQLDERVRQALEFDLAQLLAGREVLEARKAEVEKQLDEEMDLYEFKELVEKLHRFFYSISFDKKKRLVEALVDRVVLDALSPHFLQLSIEWSNPLWQTDVGLVWRTQGTAPFWREEEKEIVRQHYPTASREELQRLLPGRSWAAIQIMGGQDMKLKRRVKSQPSPIPPSLALLDYEVFLQFRDVLERAGITLEAIEGRSLSNAVRVAWVNPRDPQ